MSGVGSLLTGGAVGAGDSKSTTAQNWSKQVFPYAMDLLGQYYNQALPGSVDPNTGQLTGAGQLQAYDPATNQQVAALTPEQQHALGQIQDTAGASGGATHAGLQSILDTVGGKYLDPSSDPYLADTYNQAAQGVTDQYRSAIAPSTLSGSARANAGQPGGTAFEEQQAQDQYGLGRNLSELATSIYGGNYQQERARQLEATNMLPGAVMAQFAPAQAALGAGGVLQQQQQQEYDASRNNAMAQQQHPYEILSMLGGGLQTAAGPSGASVTTKPKGMFSDVFGAK